MDLNVVCDRGGRPSDQLNKTVFRRSLHSHARMFARNIFKSCCKIGDEDVLQLILPGCN